MSELTPEQRDKLHRMMQTTCDACNLTGYLTRSILDSTDPMATFNSLMHFLRQMELTWPAGSDQAISELNRLAIDLDIPFQAFGMEIGPKGLVN